MLLTILSCFIRNGSNIHSTSSPRYMFGAKMFCSTIFMLAISLYSDPGHPSARGLGNTCIGYLGGGSTVRRVTRHLTCNIGLCA